MNAKRKTDAPVIRLLIADDHAIVRFGLTSLLEYEDDVEVVAVAEDGETAVRLAKKHRPDIAVVDLAMPGMNGVETMKRLREAVPEIRVMIYTSFGTSGELADAVAADAAAIVLKDEGNDRLLEAIRTVSRGGRVIPEELRRIPLDRTLTDQEREILAAVARGLSNGDIAKMTGLTKDVVKHLLSDLFAHLGVATRAEAVASALQKHLL